MPKTTSAPSPLLAFYLRFDETHEIRFARHAVTARREFAGELGVHFSDVEICRREPLLDQHAPGPVSLEILFEHGWHQECGNCQRMLDQDLEKHDDGTPVGPLVFVGDNVYCNPSCRRHRLNEIKRNQTARDNLERRVLTRWPGIEILDVVANVSEPYVQFYFPNGKGIATLNVNSSTVSLNQNDLEAWHRFTDSPIAMPIRIP